MTPKRGQGRLGIAGGCGSGTPAVGPSPHVLGLESCGDCDSLKFGSVPESAGNVEYGWQVGKTQGGAGL